MASGHGADVPCSLPILFLLHPHRYPSGKPFRGRAEASLCQWHNYHLNEPGRCATFEAEVRAEGGECGWWSWRCFPISGYCALGKTAGCSDWASLQMQLSHQCSVKPVIPKSVGELGGDAWGAPRDRMRRNGTATWQSSIPALGWMLQDSSAGGWAGGRQQHLRAPIHHFPADDTQGPGHGLLLMWATLSFRQGGTAASPPRYPRLLST